jgi:hypothetical protein
LDCSIQSLHRRSVTSLNVQHLYKFTLSLRRFDAHINVECVISLAAAKYITKYTHKGSDRTTVEINRHNEIAHVKDGRYFAPAESAWRLFKFPIHHQYPSVIRLQIHLPGQHLTVFDPSESIDTVLERASHERTMLTAFFLTNRINPDANQYTYQQFPKHFTWSKERKQWSPRLKQKAIGRLFFVSPHAGERFYLRTLLTVIKGPTSWEDLRRVDDVIHSTFYDACLARGLLQDDGEWQQCLTEACATHTGYRLRQLFALILRHCEPSEPSSLWFSFRHSLCDDLQRVLQHKGFIQPSIDLACDYGLFLLDGVLRDMGSGLRYFPSMPRAENEWNTIQDNPYISAHLAFDPIRERTAADDHAHKLNDDQVHAYDQILTSIERQLGKIFFVDGPGGTGKTFLYNTLCHRIRGRGLITVCIASSGIAAQLLPGGRTAHSTFAIPVEDLCEDSSCQVDKHSLQADFLRKITLLIWDEAVMQHKYVFRQLLSLF